MNFDAFVAQVRENGWNVFGAEVWERGRLLHAFGDTRDSLREIYSITKSVLSVAVGMAWDRGLIDLERPALHYLPRTCVTRMFASQRAAFEKITLRRLLTMSVQDLPMQAEGPHWVDYALACPLVRPEKAAFHYSNISAYLVSVALTEALGEDLGGFIERHILAPLGITRYAYARCPEGYFDGATGMKLTVHDVGKLGWLLCAGGLWEGERLLSEAYIRQATAAQVPCREGGYGYLIWREYGGFSFHGKWKQRCFVLPDRERVVTLLSHIEDPCPELTDSVVRHLLSEGTM